MQRRCGTALIPSQREILDYLAPDGILVLTWNIESNDPGYYRALRELYQPLDLGSPQYYRMLWRKMFDVDVYKTSFEPAEETQVQWSVEMDEDKVCLLALEHTGR